MIDPPASTSSADRSATDGPAGGRGAADVPVAADPIIVVRRPTAAIGRRRHDQQGNEPREETLRRYLYRTGGYHWQNKVSWALWCVLIGVAYVGTIVGAFQHADGLVYLVYATCALLSLLLYVQDRRASDRQRRLHPMAGPARRRPDDEDEPAYDENVVHMSRPNVDAATAQQPVEPIERIIAPWTASEVRALNAYQERETVHIFRCDNMTCPGGEPRLIATTNGWVCPSCDHVSQWAYDFMLDLR